MNADKRVQLVADLIGVSATTMQAILNIESGGRYYGPDSLVIIRFETHIFWQLWGRTSKVEYEKRFKGHNTWQGTDDRFKDDTGNWLDVHTNQGSEWNAFRVAQSLHSAAAHKSISMGAFQIMGFNAHRVGYESAEKMLDSFQVSPLNQVVGFAMFIQSHDLVRHLVAQNWKAFASAYNGSGQAERYAGLIENEVNRLTGD